MCGEVVCVSGVCVYGHVNVRIMLDDWRRSTVRRTSTRQHQPLLRTDEARI